MPNDLINLAMRQACDIFGGCDGVFNSAGLSAALCQLSNVNGPIDGRIVDVILSGRSDVDPMVGGCHYKLKLPCPKDKE